MKPLDHFQPFDAEADFADEDASTLTSEFWRGDRHWVTKSKSDRAERSAGRTSRRRVETAPLDESAITGTIRAIRSGFSAFRPRTVEGAARADRTREHGIVRPGQPSPIGDRSAGRSAALPLATREVTIAQLASEWLDEPMPHRPANRPSTARSIGEFSRPLREGMAAAQRTTRMAAIPSAAAARRAPLRTTYDDHDDVDHSYQDRADDQHDEFELTLSPVATLSSRLGLGAVDPLLVRVGAMVLVALMLVPLALSMRSGEAPVDAIGESLPAPAVATTVFTQPPPPAAPLATAPLPTARLTVTDSPARAVAISVSPSAATFTASAAPVTFAAQPTHTAPVGPRSTTVATSPSTTADADDGITHGAVVDQQAQRIPCGDSYEIVANDSWYRIAGAADVKMQELLDVNMATAQSVLLVGADICLPQGASIAAPPTTTQVPTTQAPTTTPTTTPTATAPTSTVTPTTTLAPIPAATTAQVQQMIRDAFPDDQEEKALAVAFRESRYVATADNGSCCVGVFQIHWTAHQSWLDDFGITSRNGLKDAAKNIAAAFALYQRSGWGPWGG